MLKTMENCKKYKSSINKTEKIRVNCATEHRERRKKRRTQDFDKPRNLSPTQEDTTRSKTLQKRIERQKNKTANSQKKKPPFVVGIVRHHFSSPFKGTTEKKIDKQFREKPQIKKKITKATEKRLQAKTTKSVQQKASATSSESIDVKKKKSFASPTHKFKPLIKISEINDECDFDVSNKTDTSKYISSSTAVQKPIHRSNSDSIEEITLKISDKSNTCFQTNSQVIATKQSTFIDMKISPIESSLSVKSSLSVVEETNCSKSLTSLSEAEHFKQLLYQERDKLQKLCEKWTKIQSDNIREDICCLINQAVGQTTMLIKEKFKQFYDLIEYSKGSGRLLITSSDLHGFWDTMYIEIKDCDSRFAYLEKLRAAQWREELSSVKSVETITDKNKQAASRKRRSPSLPSDWGKKTAAQDDDKTCKKIANTTMCITPSVTDKRRTTSVFGKETFKRCDKEESANETRIYTSTPLVDRTSKLGPLSIPFITMKINQLYNKTMQINDATDSSCSWNTTVIENTITDKDNTLTLNANKIDL